MNQVPLPDYPLRFGRDLDAVVFDIGGVFSVPDHRKIGAALSEAGIPAPGVSHQAVHRAHFVGIRAFERATHTVEVMQSQDWEVYFQMIVQAVGVADHHIEDAADVVGDLMFNPPGAPARVSAWSGVIEENLRGLRRLHDAGVPLAVVSNNDGTAAEQLLALGAAQVGEGPHVPVVAIVDSRLAGVAKPHPDIFEPAIAALGVPASRALYVGDTPHCDVRGARAAGMPVVQLDPFNLYAGWDHDRIEDVDRLAEFLLAPH